MALGSSSLWGQAGAELGLSDEVGLFTLTVENDVISNHDRHYTSGVRAAYLLPQRSVPGWMEWAIGGLLQTEYEARRYEIAFGQHIYTPEEIEDPVPDPMDRPYAGWLFVSAGAASLRGSVVDQVELSLGVVGPAALADETQDLIHKIIGSTHAAGWDSQLENEPTVQLIRQRSWWLARGEKALGLEWDVLPHAGFGLGNAVTYANGGITVSVGPKSGSGYAAPRIGLTLPGNGYFEPSPQLYWQVFASFEGGYMARNIFLDGNTFRDDSPSIPKEDFVNEAQLGIQFSWGRNRFSYVQIRRSREFVDQQDSETYGALSYSRAF